MTLTVLLPGFAICLLGMLYFFIPLGEGQRVPYLATILLTEIMFLVMLTQFVPISQRVPNIVYFFFGLATLLALFSALVIVLEW